MYLDIISFHMLKQIGNLYSWGGGRLRIDHILVLMKFLLTVISLLS